MFKFLTKRTVLNECNLENKYLSSKKYDKSIRTFTCQTKESIILTYSE